MATIDELKKKDGSAVNAGVSQIPAGAGSTPAPVPDGKSDTEFGRQLQNTVSALPGASGALGGIQALARAVPAVGGAISSATGLGAKAASLTGKVAPYAIPAGGLGALSAASQSGAQSYTPKPELPGSPAAVAQSASPGSTPIAALPVQQPQAPMAAGALPQPGQVTRVGNSFSGTNVTGDISVNGAQPKGGAISAQNNTAAAGLDPRYQGVRVDTLSAGAMRGGGQVSSMDTSAGYASDLRQLAEIEKNKAAQEVSMQGQADYAAMRSGRMSKKDYQALQAGNKADATTRRGQDIQAGATRDSSRLAQERLKLDAGKAGQDATNANLDNESKTMLLNAQKAFANAKTPEERQLAMAVLSGLSGKNQQSAPWKGFALQGSTDAMGNKTEGVLAGFNEQTGEVRRMDQGAAKAATQAPPEGTTLTKDGKTYVVKNGVPVLL